MQSRKNNLAVASIDYKKAYNMVSVYLTYGNEREGSNKVYVASP